MDMLDGQHSYTFFSVVLIQGKTQDSVDLQKDIGEVTAKDLLQYVEVQWMARLARGCPFTVPIALWRLTQGVSQKEYHDRSSKKAGLLNALVVALTFGFSKGATRVLCHSIFAEWAGLRAMVIAPSPALCIFCPMIMPFLPSRNLSVLHYYGVVRDNGREYNLKVMWHSQT